MNTGELPKGWARATLGDLRQDRSKSLDPSRFSDENFELYSVPSFDTGIPEVVKGRSIGSTKRLVDPDTILICKINPRINRAWRVGDHSPYRKLASTEWIPFFPCAHIIPDLLRYFLSQNSVRNHLAANVSGVGGSLMRVRPSVLDPIAIALPPIEEQKRIVAKIDELFARLDAAEAEVEKALRLLDLHVRAEMNLAFTYKVGWEWKKVGDVARVSGGLTKSAKREEGLPTYPYLRVANVYANELRLDDVQQIGVSAGEVSRVLLRRNDLLVVEGNGSLDQIGRVALWDGSIENCVHQNHLIKVRFDSGTWAAFALFWLLSPAGRVAIQTVASSTSGLHTLSLSKVEALPIPIPPAEQAAVIVERLRSAMALDTSQRELLVSELKSVDALRQSILASAFRGELVPHDASDEPAEEFLERIRAAPRAENGKKRVRA